MLEDNADEDVVSWGPGGDCFVVKDMNEFTKSILPRMFKHSNFASFVRQLNKYDFHKIKNNEDGGHEQVRCVHAVPELYFDNTAVRAGHFVTQISKRIIGRHWKISNVKSQPPGNRGALRRPSLAHRLPWALRPLGLQNRLGWFYLHCPQHILLRRPPSLPHSVARIRSFRRKL